MNPVPAENCPEASLADAINSFSVVGLRNFEAGLPDLYVFIVAASLWFTVKGSLADSF